MPQVWFKRLSRSSLARASAGHLTAFGITASIIDGWQLKLIAGSVFVALLPATSYFVRRIGERRQLPDTILDDIAPVRKHRCHVPANPAAINGAFQLAQRHFGSSSIRRSELVRMYERNRYSLVTLQCDGIVVAYADLFILYPPQLDALRSGELDEGSMTAEMTARPDEFGKVLALYVGGIVVKDPGSGAGSRRAPILLWASSKLLLSIYLPLHGNICLYAEGYSDEGIALLKRLDFELIDAGEHQRSGDPLFGRSLSRADVNDWLSSHPDWSSICDLRIDAPA